MFIEEYFLHFSALIWDRYILLVPTNKTKKIKDATWLDDMYRKVEPNIIEMRAYTGIYLNFETFSLGKQDAIILFS